MISSGIHRIHVHGLKFSTWNLLSVTKILIIISWQALLCYAVSSIDLKRRYLHLDTQLSSAPTSDRIPLRFYLSSHSEDFSFKN